MVRRNTFMTIRLLSIAIARCQRQACNKVGRCLLADSRAPIIRRRGATAQQRGQLGVWLIESAGPGVQIARVTSGSAADRAGLQAGDAILQVNGHGAMSPIEAARMIRAIPVGQTAMLTIWHEGGERQIQVTMEPVREAYHVGYRGDENPTASVSGDLAARISQLEQQVRSMQDELQHMKQMRQQMMQTQDTGTAPGSSARPSVNNETSPPPGFGSPEQKATPSEGSTSTPGNTGTSGSSNSSGNSGTSSSASGTSGSSGSTTDSQDLFGSGPTTPSTGQSKPSSK